ncbi:hypothetical protein C2E21_7197 [Chlorella sorokiniana]|uniref:Uncharacterized protein n=1 Tax=Chlorella sorokiniana TaxID=3076 RepID=A0A2P6TIB7_CHLSO|nr:hypothetical protein C2E21_7197 [Chlorella sorokiniana]|eukprot:PRW34030.1 hypothetical protein C2E21_7197 [Chlorella sorokiniana]
MPVHDVVERQDGQYDLAFKHGGRTICLNDLPSEEAAHLLCDALAVKEAFDGQALLSELRLHTAGGALARMTAALPGLRLTLSLAAGGELIATPFTALAKQLRACAALVGRRSGCLPCAPAVEPLRPLLPQDTIIDGRRLVAEQHQVILPIAEGPTAVVLQLLETAPAAATTPDNRGRMPIHAAAAAGHVSRVEALLSAPDASYTALTRDAKGRTPLMAAAAKGHAEVAALLLASAPEAASMYDSQGRTALHHAAAGRHLAAVQVLLLPGLEAAIDLHLGCSCCSEWTATPLHWAVSHGCREADVLTILEADPGAALLFGFENDLSPLQLAIQAGRLDLAELLIPASNLCNTPSPTCTPLHTAVRCQWEAAVQMLLQAAPKLATVTSDDELEYTPLCEAAAAGCTAIVRLILEAAPEAATAGTGDDACWLPIHAAAEAGHAAVVQLLLAAAPDTAATATEEESPQGAPAGSTPLHLAAASGDVATLQLLLASTAPAAAVAVDGLGRFPAFCALAARNVAALGVLLQAAPSAASMWVDDDQLLIHAAVELPCVAAIPAILAAAPNCVAEEDADGRPPLCAAIEDGQLEAVHAILAAVPAAASLTDSMNQTPLHYAARQGCTAAIQALLALAPALPLSADDEGWLPAHAAAASGHVAALKQLLVVAPGSVMGETDDGETLHSLAAGNGHLGALRLLLQLDPAGASAGNLAPLRAALRNRRLPAARCLLSYGSTSSVLSCLVAVTGSAAAAAQTLIAEAVAARLPLLAHEWLLVPAGCPGLGPLLPQALALMASDRAARSGVLALGLLNVVLLALLFSRSSAPSMSYLGHPGLDQGLDAGHSRKLLESLVGEELAANPQEFRRRLQQAFAFSYCFSTYSLNPNWMVIDCPMFVRPTKSAQTGNEFTPNGGAAFEVLKPNPNGGDSASLSVLVDGTKVSMAPFEVRAGPTTIARIDASGNIAANGLKAAQITITAQGVKVEDSNKNLKASVTTKTLTTDEASVQKSLTVNGKTQFGDLAAANLAVGQKLTVTGSTQFGDLAVGNLAVSKSLSVAGKTTFGDLTAANLAVNNKLSVAGSTQFGNLAVGNLNVTSQLRSTGKTQLTDLSIAALTVSGAASFGGDVTASRGLRVLGNTALGTAGVTATPLDVRGKFTAQDALLDNAIVKVRGDLYVSKDCSTQGKVITRGGLVANTCSCSGRKV